MNKLIFAIDNKKKADYLLEKIIWLFKQTASKFTLNDAKKRIKVTGKSKKIHKKLLENFKKLLLVMVNLFEKAG